MASGTRSSKRKSSPSLKKKRRIKERSKKRSKISKGKSKKVSRRESSDSYSDNESLSLASSVSYSSTDGDSSRSRSRIRKDKSKRRSKSRRSRLRSKSSEKNTVKEKRGKRSKKSKDTDSKKKRLRKKPRREPSISSSSRSVSCSTCRSSDDSEREHERAEKEAKRRGRSRRDLGEDRRWLDGSSYMSEVQVPHPVEHNPRRLRSIIIFAKEFEEEEEEEEQQREVIDRDVQKEEIVYDQDDYPSPRSNDSYDGGATRRETSAGESRYLEDPRGEMVGSKIGVSELSEGCYLGVGDSFEGHDANVSSAGAGSNNVDLEAILRQKALENLRKFKGGVRANAKKPVTTKSSCDGEVKQALGLNADLEVQEKDQEGSVGGAGALSVSHQKISALNVSAAESSQILPQDSKTLNPFEKGFVDDDRLEGGEGEASPLKEGNLGADKFAEQALPTQEKPVALCMPSTESSLLPSKNLKGRIDSVDVLDKHETEASTLVQHLGTNKLDSEMIPIQESSLPMSVPAENKATVESVQPSNDDTKIVTDDVDNTTSEVPGSHASLEAQSSNVIENEDGDSQFQQKTMSVMRGGEMVQVSYKVYIPKHAPALARRKLRR